MNNTTTSCRWASNSRWIPSSYCWSKCSDECISDLNGLPSNNVTFTFLFATFMTVFTTRTHYHLQTFRAVPYFYKISSPIYSACRIFYQFFSLVVFFFDFAFLYHIVFALVIPLFNIIFAFVMCRFNYMYVFACWEYIYRCVLLYNPVF